MVIALIPFAILSAWVAVGSAKRHRSGLLALAMENKMSHLVDHGDQLDRQHTAQPSPGTMRARVTSGPPSPSVAFTGLGQRHRIAGGGQPSSATRQSSDTPRKVLGAELRVTSS
jgi:hypothetical protein